MQIICPVWSIMFERKLYQRLLAWKNECKGSRALLIEGARRVGKSTLVSEFAHREYEACLMLDFSEVSDDIRELFLQYRSDIDSFFMYLTAYTGKTLPKRQSIIVFDEVQRFPAAREFIKQLVADGRYDYIETGSLISIKKNIEGIVVPSEERAMTLHPLDYEEFLWACDERPLAQAIRSSYKSLQPLPSPLHRKAERLFREYMLVGGMPQAVEEYLTKHDFGAVDVVKRDILNLYDFDIERFGGTDATRIRRVFRTLPGQLAKHDKRYRLAALDKNARSRDYADSFFWLADSCIGATCLSVTDPSVGLSLSAEDSTFKCYMSDTGLLVSQTFRDNQVTPHEVYRDILLDKLEINEGMFTENVIAQQLATAGHGLYFYSVRDDSNPKNTMEIDFLIVKGYDDAAGRMRVSPIEVKSKKRYRTSSLNKFSAKFGERVGTSYILHPKPLIVEDDVIRLPLYMCFCL